MPETADGTVYELVGESGHPVIVLIHGLGINRHMWRDYVPMLSQRYRVLSYDLYGHNASRMPTQKPSLGLMARQLKHVLDELRVNQCAVVGFSLGGMINRRFAMDFTDRVNSLVILNSPHERSPAQQRIIEERVADTAGGGPAATLDASLSRWFTPEFFENRPDVIKQVSDWILSNDPVCYTQFREILAKGVLELVRPQPPITLPTLIMTCENDSGSTPNMAHAMGTEIQGSIVRIVPDLQHLGLMEVPELFLEPIGRFLKDNLD